MNYNGGNNNYYINNINDNDPNAYKSIEQMEQEIIVLKNKVERNKIYLQNVSIEQKMILENEITEDEIRINDLERAIDRKIYNHKMYIISIIAIIIIGIVGMLLMWYLPEIIA